MKSFGSMRKNFNIPSPKSQSPKKEPPKARRPVLNPNASPHANRLARPPRFPEICEEDEVGSDALEDDRCQSPTPVTRRKKPRSTPSASHPHVLARQSSPTPPVLQAPIVATIQVDIDESLLKQNKKRISRRQSGLITVGSGSSSSGSSSSPKSRATTPPPRAPSPAFGSPLRRDAGLAEEEEEYAAVHGRRRVDADEDVELERASSRGKKKRTLAQAQAEEAPAEAGREREKRRLREDFEVAAQRLQDVTNAFGTRASLPPLDTNVFGIYLLYELNGQNNFLLTGSGDQDRQRTPQDTDSDMPSSAHTYSSTRPPSSTPGTTPAPSHLPTPRNSSPPPIPLPVADTEASTTGRERRTRKSVNYAEPKLNTYVNPMRYSIPPIF